MSAVLSMPSATSEPSRVAAAEAANRASLTASDRLALSRERLRQALGGEVEAGGGATRWHKRGPASALMERLKSIPGASILIDALRGWWVEHPMRAAGSVALDAATAALRPMAKRNQIGRAHV